MENNPGNWDDAEVQTKKPQRLTLFVYLLLPRAVTRASGVQRTADVQLVYGFASSLTLRSHDAGVKGTPKNSIRSSWYR